MEVATPENIAILRHSIKLFAESAVNGERYKLAYSRPTTDKQRLALQFGTALRTVKGAAGTIVPAVGTLHDEAFKMHASRFAHGYFTLAESRVTEARKLLEEAEEFIRIAKKDMFK